MAANNCFCTASSQAPRAARSPRAARLRREDRDLIVLEEPPYWRARPVLRRDGSSHAPRRPSSRRRRRATRAFPNAAPDDVARLDGLRRRGGGGCSRPSRCRAGAARSGSGSGGAAGALRARRCCLLALRGCAARVVLRGGSVAGCGQPSVLRWLWAVRGSSART